MMPFGLSNGPATFQSLINSQVTEYVDHFLTAHVNDLIIYSNSEEGHEKHIKKVLEKRSGAGLSAELKKCTFRTSRTMLLESVRGQGCCFCLPS
jgi:hypothetical protein